MRKIIILFTIPCMLFACKKDKLTGDYSILEGNWKWNYTLKREYNSIYQTEVFDTIYAFQHPDKYEVEFLKKGKIRIKKNGSVEQEYRVVFEYFVYEGFCWWIHNNAWRFRIHLNNRKKNAYHGCVNQDTLSVPLRPEIKEFTDSYNYPVETNYIHHYTRN